MTAPVGFAVSTWRVNLHVAQMMLEFDKQPEKGVEGTNRKFSTDVVNRYAVSLLRGKWKFIGTDAFAFTGRIADRTAVMRNGGHRARSVVKAATEGVTRHGVFYPPNPDVFMEVLVIEGLDEDAWMAMDQGRMRSAGDHLKQRGQVDGLTLGSTIVLDYLYANVPFGPEWSKYKLEVWDRDEHLDMYPLLPEAVVQGKRLSPAKIIRAAGAVAWHQATLAGMDSAVIEEFFGQINTGVGVAENSAVHALMRLMRNYRGVYTREEQLALMIKAMMKFAKGEKVELLRFSPSSEEFPRFKK